MFLLPGFEKLDWDKGIHLNNIKPEWRNILNIIQRYITCEGRFAIVFRYHLRFLLHLNGESILNFPCYNLFKSIEKVVTQVRNHPEHTSHSIFHHGLIKHLITTELEKIDRSWQHFIFWYGFEPKSQMHDDDKEIRKKYRRQKIKVVQGGNEQA